MADHKARIPLKKRLLTAGALVTSALLMGLGITQVVGATANAAGSAFSCDENTLYAINSSGAFESIVANSGAATTLPSQSPSNNALGISQNGTYAWSTLNTTAANASGTIVRYDPVAGTSTNFSAYVPANTYRGAVDPSTGIYYYAQGNTTSAAVYGFNTTTNTAIGQVGVLSLNQASTGDFAFSTTGTLYVVSGNEVDRVNAKLPTTSSTAAIGVTKIAQLGSVTASPGIAFSTNGYLYVAVNGNVQQINPSTGTTVNTYAINDGSGNTFTPTDLASCNYADSLQAQASVDQRWQSGDQFTLTIQGDSNNTLSYGNQATTTGSATGTQSATAGSNLVTGGNTYTVKETPSGTTSLANYSTTYSCTDAKNNVVTSGNGTTATVVTPTSSDTDISCLFTNKLTAVHTFAGNDSYSTPLNTTLNVASPGVLANDGGTGNAIVSNTSPANGTVTLNKTDGSFQYVPNTGFAGTDTFTYTDQDSSGTQKTATVTVVVGPVATDDSYTATAGTADVVNARNGVLANDRGTGLTASNASTPAHGTVALNADGSFTYTPTGTYSGTDTWTYTVTDSGDHTATGTVTMTIKPKAVDDTLPSTLANTAETVPSSTALSNDTGSNLTITAVGTPSHGTATLNGDGTSFVYTPTDGYSGTDSFSYTVSDGTSTGTATEHITVTPKAVDDQASSAPAGQADSISSSSLLANDKGSSLTITSVGSATGGTVSLSGDGSTVTFTPAAGFSGQASFQYTVTDSPNGTTGSATVTIPITPTAGSGSTTATSGVKDSVDAAHGVLSGASGTGLTATVKDQPSHGSLTLNSDGSFDYTPSASYSGSDSFTYTVKDSSGSTTTGTETITVLPKANADTLPQTVSGIAETVDGSTLTANDNGSNLSVQSVGAPAHGSAKLNADGTVTYTPATGFSGTDTFPYTVTDGSTLASGTVTVVVTPKAVADTLPSTNDVTPITLPASDFLGNDLGSGLSITSVGAPSLGQVVLNGNGTVTYTPQSGFSGTYAFTYTVTDSEGRTSSATATITVTPDAGSPSTTATAGQTDHVSSTDGLLSQATGTGLTVALTSQPANGTVTLGSDGAYDYTPAAGFSGTDTFTFTVTDQSGNTSTGTATVTVLPKAADDSANAVAGHDLDLKPSDLLSNDLGTGLSVTGVSQPADGAATLNNDGSVTYTPAAGFSGPDTFTYTVTDQAGNTSTASVDVTVAPVAKNDTATTAAGQKLTVAQASGVLANDEGTSLTAALATQAAHGTVALAADGSYTYTPASGFSGKDSFTYSATDRSGQVVTATVSIDVTPVAKDVTATGLAGSPAHLDTPGVLSGDIGTGLTVTAVNGSGAPGAQVTTPAGNTVTVGSDGTFDFTPAPGFSGVDTIPVTVTDASGLSTTGHVIVTVNPKGVNDSYSTPANTALPIAVTGQTGLLGNDLGTGLTVTGVTNPAVSHGTLTKQSDGSYLYTPNNGFSGTDSFGYTATVASGLTATATVTIIVGDQAADYTATVPAGSPYGVTAQNGLLKNASGSGLTPSLDQAPQHGTVVVKADGSYTYTPAKGFSGTDSFTYRVTDSSGQVSTGQVNIMVTPTATNDSEKIGSGSTLTLKSPGVLSNDNGTALLVTAVGTPSKGGTATISGAGQLVYTPKPGFSGTETIPYTVTDQDGQTADATVTVDVTPVATSDTEQTIAGHTVTVSAANGLLANDSGSGLTAALKTAPKHGTVTVNPDGSYTYTPDKGFAGQDSFVYTATDADGQVTTATATINVLAAATAKSVTVHGKPGQKVTIAPLNSDTPTAGANFDPTTLQLIDPSTGTAVNAFTIPGKGTFAVVDGQVTFTPVAKFTGSASIGYQVSDSADQLVSATITVVIPKPGTPAAAGSDPTPVAASGGAAPKPGSLAFTGSRGVSGMLMIGFGGILLGFVLVLMRRFRREAPGPRRTGI
ncbi:Ig-like domain-containing protein [Frondihabitans australicus]|uniref:VCBS repeat-containing protein/CshA-type fibril repeat protein n=1 Tax=Frondihabitans australicus TaxID=386892 RepID=A0A495IKJ4_9MICO|nr:Ig-like domain-containing protein [Frondihabitans australicus]RKR76522.1 VCBS repeat-containing protein/CshA-type fibril repeat protein [Frondihabitans australicus]